MSPPVFHLRQSQRDLTAMSGLAFIGLGLHRFAQIARLDTQFPVRTGLPASAILASYVGLLSEGKSDFDAIEAKRRDPFFSRALGIAGVPSAATLRQRMDALGSLAGEAVDDLCVSLLRRGGARFTPVSTGHIPLDIDVFCMDNSGTKKQGVGRTYAGFDGYAPIAAYLGTEGFCLGLELRAGAVHSASETEYTLERVIPRALALTPDRILLRADSGFDSTKLYSTALGHGDRVDVLVKWNPRQTDIETLAQAKRADAQTVWTSPREGKRITRWETTGRVLTLADGRACTLRRILQLTERLTDAAGNAYLFPTLDLDGWETTLSEPIDTVIALYHDHGTHEQFHSEFKTDLDLERLPSGKFASNDLILSLAALTYNLLRLLGQQTLTGDDAPIRHPAKRRRIKTVMQELLRVAVIMTRHGRRLVLNFARHCPIFELWRRRYAAWSGSTIPA